MRHPSAAAAPLLALLSLLLLGGCLGLTQPTESQVEESITQHFNQQFAGLFTVIKVNKDNGYKQNDTHYVAQTTVTARADRTLEEYGQLMLEEEGSNPLEKMMRGMNLGLLKMTLPPFESGDTLTFKRNYLFIKTDKGWLLKKELAEEDERYSL